MKSFIGFLKKEFYHIFRDKRTMLILFGMPVMQLLLFGYVVTNEIKDARIAILDRSKDEITKKISQKILSSGYFKLEENILSDAHIDEAFKAGKIKQLIIFEPAFAQRLEKEGIANVQIISDASDPNTSNLLVNYCTAIINDFNKESNNLQKANLQIIPEIKMLYNPGLKGVHMFIPGIMALLLVLICAMITSISLTREKELGTMEVLLVSPLKPVQIIVGKVVPYVVISFLVSLIILAMGYFIFEVPIVGNLALLLAVTLLYIMVALSLGILISTRTSSQQTAMMISQVALMLPSILLSGFIYPIENMPQVLQWLCNIMPPTYFIEIIKNIMLKGVDFTYIWKETAILLGMTLFFITLSVKNFKIRLE